MRDFINSTLAIQSSLAVLCLCVVGCSSGTMPLADGLDEDVRVNQIAHRQLPPAPVYARLRFVQPPEYLPARNTNHLNASEAKVKRMFPIIHFKLQGSTLKEASLLLAASARYSSYCSSLIANRPLSMNTLGTIDELAEQIAKQANIKVVIDHAHREVRFLAQSYTPPRFYEPQGTMNEH